MSRTRLLLLVLAACLSACGGSGGGPTPIEPDNPAPTSPEGEWNVGTLQSGREAPGNPAHSFESLFGTWRLREELTVASALGSNRDGQIAAPGDVEGRWIPNFIAGNDFVIQLSDFGTGGDFSGDWNAFLGYAAGPGLVVMTRKRPGSSDETLRGTYHRAALITQSDSAISSFAPALFDGAGSVDFLEDAEANFDGFLSVFNTETGLSYGIDPDGTLRVATRFAVSTMAGGVSPSAEFAFAAGPSEDSAQGGATPRLAIFIRAGQTVSRETFRGTYVSLTLRVTLAGVAEAAYGYVSADGDGSYTIDDLLSSGGFQVPPRDGRTRSCVLAAHGRLEVVPGDGLPPQIGAISPSGRHVVLTTPGGRGHGPALTLMLRTSTEP